MRDGFDRVTQTTLRPPGTAPTAITSVASYANFTADSVEPRRVTTTTYPEPIAPANLATAEGTTVTTELDELGRTRQVREALGADYGDTLVSHQTYDPLGRVSFASDAHPQSALPPLPYGTSYHYAGDGEIDCEIRGYGPVARVSVTNLAAELLPTCVTRSFVSNQLRVTTSTPDALQAGTPQNGVTTVSTYTATGRLIQTETLKSGTRLELLQYTHDVLGHTRSLVRYGSPAGATPTLPTTWSWTYDSLGQVLTASEPEVATRTNTYSSFGELLSVAWTDTTASPAQAMRLEYTYDALGRKLSSVERQDGADIPDTAYTWTYDTSAGSPHLTSQNALGRLTKTSAGPSGVGDMLVSYDATGQVSARTYVSGGFAYHERFGNRLDGSLAWLELALPDNAYATERVDYGYDSAQRLRSIMAGATSLYGATTIDVLGRVRAAELGDNTHYTASYQEVGRRLPLSETYELTSGRSRTTLYQSFDAMGRELVRREDANGAAGNTTTRTYSALGHLATSRDTTAQFGFPTVANHTFTTDALGNAISAISTDGSSVVTSERRATHSATDRDRMCRLDYGPATAGECNVLHDGAGNIRSYPARGGTTRTLTFNPSGSVRQIQQGSLSAHFRYDGSGFIEELGLRGVVDPRTDLRLGLTRRRNVSTAGVWSSIFVRSIPGPGGGTIATRHGAAGPWIYPAGDSQGTRRTFDDGTEVHQEISYTPFGVATSTGPAPTSATYTRNQWNGGDALADLGLVVLGARIYDPQLGRFLSRDPLVIPRSASKVNPYAFAWNDPINFGDPNGLETIPTGPPVGCPDGGCLGLQDALDAITEITDWVSTPERETSFLEDLGAVSASILATVAPVTPEYWGALGDASVRAAFACDKNVLGFTGCVYGNVKDAEAYYQVAAMVTALGSRIGARIRKWQLAKAKLQLPAGGATTTIPRLPQDVGVNPVPPRAMNVAGRTVGKSAAQNSQVQADIASARAAGGRDFRVNQQQVSASGIRVGKNRPDLQYTDARGNRVYIEYDSPTSGRGLGHQTRILANDPTGLVTLKIIP